MTSHRGRIQSQGGNIEDSEPWNQENPILASVAKNMANILESRHSKKEKKLREIAFRRARAFIKQAKLNGGVSHPVSQNYMIKGDAHRRIDIEVKKGIAFVDDEK